MPLILVVEQEQRYVERIEEALGPQGWEVAGVDGRANAMRRVADRAADLVVVSSRVDDAAELIETFSRANGGPGVVVMVPESGDEAAKLGADEVLAKPFTDQDIRLAVRRCMSAAREVATEASTEIPAQPAERLSSEDLFGDVVLELEGAFQLGGAAAEVEEEPAGLEPSVSKAEPEAVAEVEVEAVESVEEPVEPVEEPMKSAEEVAEAIESSPPEPIAEEAEAEEAPEPLKAEEEEPAAVAIEADETGAEALVEAEAEEAPAREEPVEEEPVEEEPVEEEPAEPEPPLEPPVVEEEPVVEAVEEERLAEVPEVEDVPVAAAEESASVEAMPRKRLEDRLREAVSEGMAAAAATDREPADSGEDASRVTDLLLQKALATVRPAEGEEVELDAEFTEPALATDEEIDQLVSTVIGGGGEEEVEASDTAAAEAPAVGEAADGWMDEEAPALDVLVPEATESEEGEYRARMKLLWAVIVIALLALLAFVLTWPKGESEVPAPSAPVGAAAQANGAETTLEGAVDGTSAETSAEREERLRQELEAERRLPQESDSRGEDAAPNDSEEDGGGV